MNLLQFARKVEPCLYVNLEIPLLFVSRALGLGASEKDLSHDFTRSDLRKLRSEGNYFHRFSDRSNIITSRRQGTTTLCKIILAYLAYLGGDKSVGFVTDLRRKERTKAYSDMQSYLLQVDYTKDISDRVIMCGGARQLLGRRLRAVIWDSYTDAYDQYTRVNSKQVMFLNGDFINFTPESKDGYLDISRI